MKRLLTAVMILLTAVWLLRVIAVIGIVGFLAVYQGDWALRDGVWYCKELGILFGYNDARSKETWIAYGVRLTGQETETIYFSIAHGGSASIIPVSEAGKRYEPGRDTAILRGHAKIRNGRLLVREQIDGEETGKVYVFGPVPPGPVRLTGRNGERPLPARTAVSCAAA